LNSKDRDETKQLSNSDFFVTPTGFGTSAWEQSLASIHRALELLGRISPTVAMVLAVVLVAVIAWFDYVTGDFSLALFYLVPVVLATWNAGRLGVWFIGVLSAAAWLVGDLALSHVYGHLLMPYWNAAMLASTASLPTFYQRSTGSRPNFKSASSDAPLGWPKCTTGSRITSRSSPAS
jgi:hypothetical protein